MGQLAEVGDQMKETLFLLESQSERLNAQQTARLYTHRSGITAAPTQRENMGRLSFL